MRRGISSAAFTLVELMLVVVIISLLIGIMMPALVHARRAATAVQCSARQAQLMVGVFTHAHDHKDLLPYPNWSGSLSDEPNAGWLYTAPVLVWDNDAQKTGTMWEYLQTSEVYHCQSHRPEQEGSAGITSYLMNGAVMAYGRSQRPFRLDQFRPMSAIFWDAEDRDPDVSNGMAGDRSDGATWPGILPRPRHGDAINVSIIDGSVIRMTLDEYQSEQIKYPGKLWCVPTSLTGD
ncbi:MAG: type II secretion system protein [Phycisphaerales bacterium]|nr:type II secretion system protein [Phycisphaerales bacterium]